MKNTRILWLAGSGASLLSVAALLLGCQSSGSTVASAKGTGKGGAQLWAESCARCHNVRSPSIYSDAEWDVAMHHMRVRANLSAADTETITKFLRSAN